jgi:hypothetical protein
MRESAIAFGCVMILISVLLAITQEQVTLAGNEASRFALIESLVDSQQWNIDGSSFRTGDIVRIGGKAYSNKPPFVALWGAGAYGLVKATLGWSFETHRRRVVYLVTLLTIGLCTLGFHLLLAHAYARDPRIPSPLAPVLALAVVLGTTLISYSGTLNDHVPPAPFLLAALLAAKRGRPTLCGAAVGMCLLLNLVFGVVFGLCLVLRWRERCAAMSRYLAALGCFAAVFALVNQIATGFPLPPFLHLEGPGVQKPFGQFGLIRPDTWDYPIQALVGYRGFFVYSPILLVPLLGAKRIVRTVRRDPCGLPALALSGSALVILLHVCLAGGYGGWAYGYRYLIPLVAVFALAVPELWVRHRTALSILLIPSLILAALGCYAPWPPSYQGERASQPIARTVRFNAGSNLACLLVEHDWPGAARLSRWFIDSDPRRALLYQIMFFRVRRDDDVARHLMRRLAEFRPATPTGAPAD